jgi:hypothetical protein
MLLALPALLVARTRTATCEHIRLTALRQVRFAGGKRAVPPMTRPVTADIICSDARVHGACACVQGGKPALRKVAHLALKCVVQCCMEVDVQTAAHTNVLALRHPCTPLCCGRTQTQKCNACVWQLIMYANVHQHTGGGRVLTLRSLSCMGFCTVTQGKVAACRKEGAQLQGSSQLESCLCGVVR